MSLLASVNEEKPISMAKGIAALFEADFLEEPVIQRSEAWR
jgi:hypothetical protein